MYKNKRCLFYIFSLNALHSGLPLSVLTSAWTVITLQWLVSKVSCFIHFQIFFFFLSQILAKGPHRVHYPRKTSIKFFSSVKTIYLQKMAYLALCWQRLTKTASLVFQLKTVLYEPCTFWRKGLKPGVLSVSHHSLLQHHKGMVFRRAPLRVHFLTEKLEIRN